MSPTGEGPLHPGTVLRDLIRRNADGKITQESLADAMRVSRFTVSQIINGHRSVTPDMAVRLAYVLGTSAELWLNLQTRFDLHAAKRELANELKTLDRLREPELDPPTSAAA